MRETNNKIMEEKERLNLLYSLFKLFAGKEIDMTLFSDRLKFQKIIYIMISTGIKLNYDFGWHLRGPYSSSLAGDGFTLSNQAQSLIDIRFRIPENYQRKIENIKEIFSGELFDTDKLELYSSVLFIIKSNEALTEQEIIEHIKNRKPWFDENPIRNAIHKLRNSGLFGI